MFDNPDGLLIAGGYANLLLGMKERQFGIRVPQTAILIGEDGTYVLTVNEQGVVETASVRLGKTLEGDMEVIDGLHVGDRVVVQGVQKVKPGMTAAVTLNEVTE